jgi:hypothetical protein
MRSFWQRVGFLDGFLEDFESSHLELEHLELQVLHDVHFGHGHQRVTVRRCQLPSLCGAK